jgi:hypothetical protein
MSSGRILSKKVTKWSLMRQRLVYLEWNGLLHQNFEFDRTIARAL